MTYPEFINRLYKLSDIEYFKKEIQDHLNYYGDSPTEKSKYGIATYLDRTNFFEDKDVYVENSYTNNLLRIAQSYHSHPATKIIEPIIDEDIEKVIIGCQEKIRLAIKFTDDPYFYDFPDYIEALKLIQTKLDEIRQKIFAPQKKVGNPNFKGLKLEDRDKIISEANRLLKSDPEVYSPRSGAFVSEQLKNAVTDNLKHDIPELSIYQVGRVLIKHMRNSNR